MKRIIFTNLSILCFSLICLSGCKQENNRHINSTSIAPSAQTSTNSEHSSETAQEIVFPKEYKKTIDKITIDMPVILPDGFSAKEACTATAVLQKIDPKNAVSILMKDKELTETILSEAGDQNEFFYEGTDGSKLSVHENSSMLYIESADDSLVGSFRNALNLAYGDEHYNAEKYLTNKTFDFALPENAFSSFQDLLVQIGFDVSGIDFAYTCYALDHETMAQEEVVIEPSTGMVTEEGKKSEWTKADDSYYFAAYQQYGGLRIVTKHEQLPVRLTDVEAPISTLYSASGHQEIRVEQVFNIKKGDQVQLLSFEEIIEQLLEKYTMVLGDETQYHFERAELIYLASGNDATGYSLSPVWVFQMKETYRYSTGQVDPPKIKYEVIPAVA